MRDMHGSSASGVDVDEAGEDMGEAADSTARAELCMLGASILLHLMQVEGQCRRAGAASREFKGSGK